MNGLIHNLNGGLSTAVCFLGLRKCFDTINHNILVQTLLKYGVRNNELMWFQSYLTDFQLVVKCNNYTWTSLPVNIGISQA